MREQGESVEDAAKREFKEETDMTWKSLCQTWKTKRCCSVVLYRRTFVGQTLQGKNTRTECWIQYDRTQQNRCLWKTRGGMECVGWRGIMTKMETVAPQRRQGCFWKAFDLSVCDCIRHDLAPCATVLRVARSEENGKHVQCTTVCKNAQSSLPVLYPSMCWENFHPPRSIWLTPTIEECRWQWQSHPGRCHQWGDHMSAWWEFGCQMWYSMWATIPTSLVYSFHPNTIDVHCEKIVTANPTNN